MRQQGWRREAARAGLDEPEAFVRPSCNGFQERASIFAANSGTKAVEAIVGLQRGAHLLASQAVGPEGLKCWATVGDVVVMSNSRR